MNISHRHIRKFIGQHIQCHTHFGTFRGVVIHCTKHHVILGIMPRYAPTPYETFDWAETADGRPFMMGGGPAGPGGPGPGWGGGGWNLAIPLAAIIGVTAIGMHWW